ncbi:hypothetical protein [Fluviicola sp.]|jgi:hypothetical protein|uniref:hypothetical protein n=1 Tax=Fluviicola sp. TaxID=1917219 RepID=UPI00281D822C|nr:hypothetical protein [Fluviicola sp.]MDR0802939.1 hypothetical protein [Fluviicola sp.]
MLYIRRVSKFRIITILFFCFSLVAAPSCKKKEETVDMYYDYFPQTGGQYVVYSVHEVIVDTQVNQKDTLDYFIKTVIGDTLIDNQGRVVHKFERYKSASASGPWSIQDVWTCVIDGPRGELVEENNRTIKLVFAPNEDDLWNMNAYNTLDPLECYYSGLHAPYSLNGMYFSSTVTVEQEDFSSYIDSRRKYEVYARGVGMIYKYYRDFVINNGIPDDVKKGQLLVMSAVAYGQQ